MNELETLQEWFQSHCDGEYEHGEAIVLQTLDNPGWFLRVDLNGTELSLPNETWTEVERDGASWLDYRVEENVFECTGDVSRLGAVIRLFLDKVRQG